MQPLLWSALPTHDLLSKFTFIGLQSQLVLRHVAESGRWGWSPCASRFVCICDIFDCRLGLLVVLKQVLRELIGREVLIWIEFLQVFFEPVLNRRFGSASHGCLLLQWLFQKMAQIWDFWSLLWLYDAFFVGATELEIWCDLSWFYYSWCRDQIHQNFRFILQIVDGGFPLLWRHIAVWLLTSWFFVGAGVRSSELIKYGHRVDNWQIWIWSLCQRNLWLLLHQF